MMSSEKTRLRRRLLWLFSLFVAWALLGCRLVNLISSPTPEPTFAPLPRSTTPLEFSPEKLPEAQAGQAYTAIITIAGNETPVYIASIQSGELPPGLVLQEVRQGHTLEISGTPQQPGEYIFTLSVGCFGTMVSGQEGQYEYRLVVKK